STSPPPYLCARQQCLKSASSNGGSSQAQVVRHGPDGHRDGRVHGAEGRRGAGTRPQPHLRRPHVVHHCRGPGVGGRPGLRLSPLLSDVFILLLLHGGGGECSVCMTVRG
ncbi:unnamed protein product, partial [Musa textilis]